MRTLKFIWEVLTGYGIAQFIVALWTAEVLADFTTGIAYMLMYR